MVNITSKSELTALASKLKVQVVGLKSQIESLKAKLATVTDYDGINMSGAANILRTNLTNISTELDTVSKNIENYVAAVEEFDRYDFVLEDPGVSAPLTVPVGSSPSTPSTPSRPSATPLGNNKPSNTETDKEQVTNNNNEQNNVQQPENTSPSYNETPVTNNTQTNTGNNDVEQKTENDLVDTTPLKPNSDQNNLDNSSNNTEQTINNGNNTKPITKPEIPIDNKNEYGYMIGGTIALAGAAAITGGVISQKKKNNNYYEDDEKYESNFKDNIEEDNSSKDFGV